MFWIEQLIIFIMTLFIFNLVILPIFIWIFELINIDNVVKWLYEYNQSVVDFLNNLFGIKKKETK